MPKDAFVLQASQQDAPAARNFWVEHKTLFQLLGLTCALLCSHLLWLYLGYGTDVHTHQPRAMQPLHTFLPARDPNILTPIATSSGHQQAPHDAVKAPVAQQQMQRNSGWETTEPFRLAFFDPRASLTRESRTTHPADIPGLHQISSYASSYANEDYNNAASHKQITTDKSRLFSSPNERIIQQSIRLLQEQGAIFQSWSGNTNRAALGPAPQGLFFTISFNPATAGQVMVQVPLAKEFHLYEITPQGQLVIHQTHNVISLAAPHSENVDYIGYVETDYPTHLFLEHVPPELTASTISQDSFNLALFNQDTWQNSNSLLAELNTLIHANFTLGLTALMVAALGILSLRTWQQTRKFHWQAPWPNLLIMTELIFLMTILTVSTLTIWPFDPIPSLLIATTVLWATQHIVQNQLPNTFFNRPWLIPSIMIGLLLFTAISPTARGPAWVLIIGLLLLHSATMQINWPMPNAIAASAKGRFMRWTVMRILPALGLGLAGLSLISWIVPVIDPLALNELMLLTPACRWHLLASALALSAFGHGVAVLQKIESLRRARAFELVNQANIDDRNRTILTQLSQQLTPEHSVARARGSTMRSDENNPSRVNLSTIGESPQSPFEKVAEYADISALLDEEAKWSRTPLNVSDWLEKYADAWTHRVNRHNLQLIISIKPNTPVTIFADEAKLTHMVQSFLDISVNNTQSGNIILRLDATENDNGSWLYRISLQDNGAALPEKLSKLLKTNWLELIAKPFEQTHVKYARILLAHRWLYLAQGKLAVEHDPMSGTRFQLTFKTKAQQGAITQEERQADEPRASSTLLMTYDAEYATTMAEQANYQNNPMSLALSTKQAMRNIKQSKTAGRSFQAIIVDFSRDAESLQGFIFELKEKPEYEQTPIILLTHPHQRVDYLTQIMREVYAMRRPGYYPQLSAMINSILFKSNPNLHNALKNASHQIRLPRLSEF